MTEILRKTTAGFRVYSLALDGRVQATKTRLASKMVGGGGNDFSSDLNGD